MRVKSFDVFDTLLTRKVGLPGHIFLLTGQRIADQFGLDIEPEVFANARSIAERELVRQGLVSSDIYDIYKKLTATLELPEELSSKLAGAELETEYREIIAVEKNVQLVEQLRSEGEQVIYISDMYLGEPVIRKLLTDRGICREGEQIYVSCDHGVNKSSGKLFDVVAGDLGIEKRQMHHYGNSMRSDIKGAEKAGVRATYLAECNLNRYEKQLCNVNEKHRLTADQTLLYSRMAAAARLSRLEREEAQSREIYDVASCVAAPVLYRFVDYVLSEAGDKKIYFLARDGHIMYQIAERIIKARGYKTEIKYLYISREALVLAMFDEHKAEELLDLFKKIYANDTLEYIFNLFSITDEILKLSGFSGLDKIQKLSELSDEEIHRLLFHELIFEKIRLNSKERKKNLINYLQKEGFLDSKGSVIADTGWYLTIQNLLAELLQQCKINPTVGLYFGINEKAYGSVRKGSKKGYFWNWRKENKPVHVKRLSVFMEIICPSVHGRTIDYRSQNGVVRPVLDSHETGFLVKWGVKDLEDGILRCVDQMLKLDHNPDATPFDQDILLDLAQRFWCTPSLTEIERWGKYPFVITRDGASAISLFERYTYLKTLKRILKSGKLPDGNLEYWPFAHIYSLSRSKKASVRYSLLIKRKLHLLRNEKKKLISI